MRLIVRPRHALPKLDLDVPYVVVSITDPPPFGKAIELPYRANRKAHIDLRFCDVYHDDDGTGTIRVNAMRDPDADAIANLIVTWGSSIGAVVISCDAAGSRSPSVAFAIADHLRLPRSCIDWRPEHVHGDPPNVWVYDKVREGLARAGKKGNP